MHSERDIWEFWQTAAEWMQETGNDEAELLRRFPSYRGTRPGEGRRLGVGTQQAQPGRRPGPQQARPQVLTMPPPTRDWKMCAAGDYDDAA
jgi:hypothetical protein